MAERMRRSTPAEQADSTPYTVNGADESHSPTRRKPGPIPGTEAAKRGGTAVREKYGRDFYKRIGAKGGAKAYERQGSTFYRAMGQRGGESTKQRLGTEHYARIGRIGGKHSPSKRGADGEATTSNADTASR